jgi:hypothetical protein
MTMKLEPALAASLFAAMASFAFNVSAVADTPAAAMAVPDASAPAKSEKAAHPLKMGPHSHAEVKTGVRQRTPEATPEKSNPATDRTRHFHPRDGK